MPRTAASNAIAATVLSALLVAAPAPACTSFCLDTPGGPVFGTNLDLFIPGDGQVFVNRRGMAKRGLGESETGARAEWTALYGSVTFNLAGRLIAWGGMNEAGLTMSSMELRAGEYAEPDGRPPLTGGEWSQYILDTCADIDDVLRMAPLVRYWDHVYTNHYLIVDATGRGAAVEWLDGELVIRTGEDLPVLAMANMRYERSAQAVERGGPRWWWSNPGASAERVMGACERARTYDAARDTSAVQYAFDTLQHVVGAPHTRWSIVYDVAAREVWFRTDQRHAIKRLALADFDLACGEPLVLDVNTDLVGDVGRAFTAYDPARNREIFATFCARYGLELAPEVVDGVMGVLAGFRCSP